VKERKTIGIIGFGVVGRSIHHTFAQLADFKIYDINHILSENSIEEVCHSSDYIFVCVPTPMKRKTGEFDSSILESTLDNISEYSKKNIPIIIKSTCLPGTTENLQKKYKNLTIVFSPEFLTERSYLLDAINPSRIIFGIQKANWVMSSILELYKIKFPHSKIFFCDTKTAEMVKYVSNTFLATKVSFFNEVYQLCEKIGIDYNRLIKMVLADGRIGNSHVDVPGHDGDFGYGGKCFPKDINAFIKFMEKNDVNPYLLKASWKKNLEVRKKKDWEKIEGAIS
jgi:UDPglucose 6-dehydrogenase